MCTILMYYEHIVSVIINKREILINCNQDEIKIWSHFNS